MRIFTLCLLFFHNYVAYSENIPTKDEMKKGPILNKVTCNSQHQNGGTWKSYCASLGRICDDSGDRAKCCQEGDENCIDKCDTIKEATKSWKAFCETIGAKCITDTIGATCECIDHTKIYDKDDEVCKADCDAFKEGTKSWKTFCQEIGARCTGDTNEITCECAEAMKIYDKDDEVCKDKCDTIKEGTKSWKTFCEEIGARCIGDANEITCECTEAMKIYDKDDEVCKDKCDTIKEGTKSWKTFCEEIGARCIGDANEITCECTEAMKIYDKDDEVCKDKCYQYLFKDDFREIMWNDFCLGIGAVCVSSNEGPKCECEDGKIFSEVLEKCIEPCDEESMKDEYTTWRDFCSMVGAQCVRIGKETTCECRKGLEYSRKVDICVEQCDKNAMKNESIKWKDFCSTIGADCVSSTEGTTCLCEIDKVYDDNLEKCIDKYETCDSVIDGTKTWNDFCREKGFGPCRISENLPECKCSSEEKFDHDRMDCIKRQLTCDSIIPGGTKTWNQFCIEKELLCEDEDIQAECLCPYGEKFDRSLMNCVRDIPRPRNCKKLCLNGGYCTLNNSSEVCICSSTLTGENCERPNFCKIHHQDGLSGEEYCERGDAECISEENLICHCYNPHRYFDYETGMCINPCTTRPCRNGGRCIFKGTPNPTCECNPYFIGNRCEEVNWCRIKRISGRTVERYCASHGAFCGIIGTGKVDCICKDRDYEFNHSLQKCIEIDVCAVNRRGFQDCSLKNAICKKDILSKHGDKYICECPSGRKMLENGTCAENTICEEGEKGYVICNRRRANCVINDFHTKGFECECEEGYAPNDHEICIDINICTEGHQGYKECESRDAICLHNFDNDVGYECGCKPGYKMTEIGICIEITECDNGQIGYRECRAKNANCIQDFKNYKRYKCVCPERYALDINGRCRKKNFGIPYFLQAHNNVIPYIDSCDEGNHGYIECMKINAICISNNYSYSCHCRPNQKIDSSGKCTDLQLCDKGEIGFKECGILSSVCIQSKGTLKGYKCVCSKLHVVDQFGRCINNFYSK